MGASVWGSLLLRRRRGERREDVGLRGMDWTGAPGAPRTGSGTGTDKAVVFRNTQPS